MDDKGSRKRAMLLLVVGLGVPARADKRPVVSSPGF